MKARTLSLFRNEQQGMCCQLYFYADLQNCIQHQCEPHKAMKTQHENKFKEGHEVELT